MYMSEGVMTYPWSDFRRLLNRVTSIGPWICHNALRHIHGTTLFLKGKNDTCFFFMVPSKTHSSQPYVTVGLIILQYNFNFDFLETNLLLTLRRLMSYIYMEHPFLMFLDHTQRRSTVGRTPLDE